MNLHLAGAAGIIIFGILMPGPEEVVLAAAGSKGIRLVKHAAGNEWRAYRIADGQELTPESLEQTLKAIAEEVAKRENAAKRGIGGKGWRGDK